MTRFDPSNAECLVFTYKEGLLSPIAHDLQIRVTRFSIDVSEERAIVATFDAGSLRVVSAMKDGRESALSDKDKREIEKNIASDVLVPKRHPDIRFRSTEVTEAPAGGLDVAGELVIRGASRRITAHLRPEGDRLVAELTLHQPDFGIKPYRAALGTLKVQPDVKVRLSVPRAEAQARATR